MKMGVAEYGLQAKYTKIKFSAETTLNLEWLESNAEAEQRVLKKHKGTYPVCLCVHGGVPLYIAKKNSYYLCCMPQTKSKHAPSCYFYEIPEEYSGSSAYTKRALEDNHDGTFSVNLDANLSAIALNHRPSPAQPDSGNPSKIKYSKMTLLGLMQLLWEMAGFNKWSPHMSGKRRYPQWYKYITQASQRVLVKNQPVSSALFIPEPFFVDHEMDINSRSASKLHQISHNAKGELKRFLVMGMIKKYIKSPYGGGIQLQQYRNLFWMDEVLVGQVQHSFLQDKPMESFITDDSMIAVIMVVELTDKNNYHVVNASFMQVTKSYIPFMSSYEKQVTEMLVSQHRYFTKPLRYDALTEDVFPDFILTDVGSEPLIMEVFGFVNNAKYEQRKREKIAYYRDKNIPLWFWDVGHGDCPRLPEKTSNH